MANFPPLKAYMFFCLDKMIARYHLQPPFLDAGCGTGDVSAFLARRGWHGKAIDLSPDAIVAAQKRLMQFHAVEVEKKNIFEERGCYKTIILWDCLEHTADDKGMLKKIFDMLTADGMVLIAVPSNPREWNWDDDCYGHYRRYTANSINALLKHANLTPVLYWDFTFPFFWAMRRIALLLSSPPDKKILPKDQLTAESSLVHLWSLSPSLGFYDPGFFLWPFIYHVQYALFKKITWGHEMFILVKKV